MVGPCMMQRPHLFCCATQKRPGVVSGTKLAVPKPVNLPSIKKEHAGNDPTTQLVPSSSGAGWTKPEEPAPPPAQHGPPAVPQSALTASSNWAAPPPPAGGLARVPPGQNRAGAGWTPPVREGPYAPSFSGPGGGFHKPPFPTDRALNPEEYPSLAATARSGSVSKPRGGAEPQLQQQVCAMQGPARNTGTSEQDPVAACNVSVQRQPLCQ